MELASASVASVRIRAVISVPCGIASSTMAARLDNNTGLLRDALNEQGLHIETTELEVIVIQSPSLPPTHPLPHTPPIPSEPPLQPVLQPASADNLATDAKHTNEASWRSAGIMVSSLVVIVACAFVVWGRIFRTLSPLDGDQDKGWCTTAEARYEGLAAQAELAGHGRWTSAQHKAPIRLVKAEYFINESVAELCLRCDLHEDSFYDGPFDDPLLQIVAIVCPRPRSVEEVLLTHNACPENSSARFMRQVAALLSARQAAWPNQTIAVFIDLCCLDRQDLVVYEQGLANSHRIYAHPATEVWLLDSWVFGIDDDEDETIGAWHILYQAVSCNMLKCADRCFDLGRLLSMAPEEVTDWIRQVHGVCQIPRCPPPTIVQFHTDVAHHMLRNSADLALIVMLYEEHLLAVLRRVIRITCCNLQWGDSEVRQLAGILPYCLQLQHLDLSHNPLISNVGAAVLATHLPPTVDTVDLRAPARRRHLRCGDSLMRSLPSRKRFIAAYLGAHSHKQGAAHIQSKGVVVLGRSRTYEERPTNSIVATQLSHSPACMRAHNPPPLASATRKPHQSPGSFMWTPLPTPHHSWPEGNPSRSYGPAYSGSTDTQLPSPSCTRKVRGSCAPRRRCFSTPTANEGAADDIWVANGSSGTSPPLLAAKLSLSPPLSEPVRSCRPLRAKIFTSSTPPSASSRSIRPRRAKVAVGGSDSGMQAHASLSTEHVGGVRLACASPCAKEDVLFDTLTASKANVVPASQPDAVSMQEARLCDGLWSAASSYPLETCVVVVSTRPDSDPDSDYSGHSKVTDGALMASDMSTRQTPPASCGGGNGAEEDPFATTGAGASPSCGEAFCASCTLPDLNQQSVSFRGDGWDQCNDRDGSAAFDDCHSAIVFHI